MFLLLDNCRRQYVIKMLQVAYKTRVKPIVFRSEVVASTTSSY